MAFVIPRSNYYYDTGIILIKQDGREIFCKSKCFSSYEKVDKCVVESDNQKINDLIYYYNSDEPNEKYQLSIIMDLTYKKAYHLYGKNTFRIEVEETGYRMEILG